MVPRVSLLVLLVLLICGAALATTWPAPQMVQCPLDAHGFSARLPKTELTRPVDSQLRRPVPGPVYRCPKCGFAGAARDFRHALRLTPEQKRAQHEILRRRPPTTSAHELSAELAEARGAPAADVARRFLEAAASTRSGSVQRRGLLLRARDALLREASGSASAAYGAAELSRQLGEAASASRWFTRVAEDARAPVRLRQRARRALSK